MSSVKLTCPQCQAPLRFLKAPKPGKAIRCPGCQLKFTPPANVLAALEADETTSSSAAMWTVLGGVAVLLLGVAVLAVWRPWSSDAENPAPAAATTSPGDPPSSAQPSVSGSSTASSAEQGPDEVPAGVVNETAPAAQGAEEQADPFMPPPAKLAPKTYAELKRPDDLAAPPALANINTTPVHPLQSNINLAIERAVAYLQKTQMNSGSWAAGNYQAGHAALGGLALLEGGVPADHSSVQKVAEHIRNTPIGNHRTYQVSLAILFLDRLGDPEDVPLIQSLAMQLIAGQSERGGWGYECPVLTAQQVQHLYKTLKALEPKLPVMLSKDKESRRDLEKSPPDKPTRQAAAQPSPERPTFPMPKFPMKKSQQNKQRGAAPGPRGVLQMPTGPNHPVLEIPGLRFLAVREDNSNTQFALMAIWTARRHGVPAFYPLLRGAYQLAETQNSDGGWGYNSGGRPSGTTPAMTCVGLLGLAMGHGLAQQALQKNGKDGKEVVAAADPRIEAGLRRLGADIQTPGLRNLYFAWSVERVAMLYKLPTIGNKDWYDLGARQLVKEQQVDGDWRLGVYPGSEPSLDTSFAVLFLKRTNLVQDLSDRLPLFMAISDPDAGPRR